VNFNPLFALPKVRGNLEITYFPNPPPPTNLEKEKKAYNF
jgi:hypothetical protein